MKNTLLILVLILLTSCGSKKKALQKSSFFENIQIENSVESSLEISEDVLRLESSGSFSTEETEETTVEVEADSSGVVTREIKSNPDGTITEIIKGATKVTFSREKKKAEKTDTLALKEERSLGVKEETKTDSSISIKRKKGDKELELDVTSGSWWFWGMFFVWLIIAFIIYLAYKNRGKIWQWVKKAIPWI